MTRELTAATEHAGVRLDAFLSADGALTRSQAARLIAEGRVRVNGKPAAKSARLPGCRPGKYHAAGLRPKIVLSLLPKQKYGAGRIFLKKVLDFIK